MRNADEFDAFKCALLKSFKLEMSLIDYTHLEYGVETSVTDEDILNILIDYALDVGDRDLFMRITEQLQEV
ncbi:IDEAL domain-containing protein [Virgibacillus sp. AGTR]|uniref:IDEAL domain-containing protein n=1 Tax=Virgibacillus sp. AGTR TaxID=2812055 RepID=UPI0019642A26|nr:IDEAL domain-containing protein [Virgibacillus sp. AGTR]MCC2250518.1 IDEAL domain-containing protein [Virgibacillus sp. AGTR]QRZ18303.1 IDEAL domain-containing protein [Virgibacillus sp. AGTR]